MSEPVRTFMQHLSEKYNFSPEKEMTEYVGKSHDDVIMVMCELLGVGYAKIISRTRKRPVVTQRHCIAWALVESKMFTQKQAAYELGGRDRTTVIHSHELVNDMIETKDPMFADYVNSLMPYVNALRERKTPTAASA